MSADESWWQQGIRFQCQGSGKCCVSRDEYGYVYLTHADRIRMAKNLGLPTASFTKKFCIKEEGLFRLKDGTQGRCLFLKGKACQVYEGRPTQCRTWPFWPEVMNAKTWQREVAQFCPGVGKGPIHSAEDIRKVLQEQEDSEDQYGS